MGEQISISKSEYDSLVKDSIILSYLEQFGVDNWDGYGEAMLAYREESEQQDE